MSQNLLNIKIPPHSLEAEQSVLGGILLNNKAIPEVAELISPDDFYREAHSLIFQAMINLYQSGSAIDLVTLANELTRQDLLEKAGGAIYLTSLIEDISTSAGIKNHAEIVKEKADQRNLIELCSSVSEDCFSQVSTSEEILSKLKAGIRQIEQSQSKEIEDNNRFYMKVYEGIYEKREPGLYPGINCLDNQIYFEQGYIHAIAAESNVGKSAFILQISSNIADKYGPCLLYSLESTRQRLALRHIARHSKVALTRINKCHFSGPEQEEKIMEAVSSLSESRLIMLDDSRFQIIERLIAHAESYALRHKISAIFIDFLQLLSSYKKHNTRHAEISYIVTQIKYLAKSLNIPVIFASQLRKDVKGRPDLDTLKESGDIRTHSDNVLFLYAPEKNETIYPVEIFLAKGKEQERFSQWLTFNGNYQMFSEGEEPEETNYRRRRNGFDE